jgi:hypothetical protein
LTDSSRPVREQSRMEAYLDPYRPLPPAPAPGTGSADPADTEMARQEEPSIPGTLFLTIVLLMIIAGVWIVMFLFLLAR